MAEVEERAATDPARVARVARAGSPGAGRPLPGAYLHTACGARHESWRSVCENCGAFGTLQWRAPGTYGQILPPEPTTSAIAPRPLPAACGESSQPCLPLHPEEDRCSRRPWAGSLPKPSWLATPPTCCGPAVDSQWRAAVRGQGKIATLLAIRRQEEAGLDIVSDGEQARQHFSSMVSWPRSTASISTRRSAWASATNRYRLPIAQPWSPPLKRPAASVHEAEARIARAAPPTPQA